MVCQFGRQILEQVCKILIKEFPREKFGEFSYLLYISYFELIEQYNRYLILLIIKPGVRLSLTKKK